MLGVLKLEQAGDVWNNVIENSLDDILERSFNQISNPILDEVGNKINNNFKDPIQRSKSIKMNTDVANIGNLESAQL